MTKMTGSHKTGRLTPSEKIQKTNAQEPSKPLQKPGDLKKTRAANTRPEDKSNAPSVPKKYG